MANYKNLIEKMIDSYIVSKGIHDASIIDAIRSIPRHSFVEESFSELSIPIRLFQSDINRQYREFIPLR